MSDAPAAGSPKPLIRSATPPPSSPGASVPGASSPASLGSASSGSAPSGSDWGIRSYADGDWPGVWAIISEVIQAADTFPYDPAMTADQARGMWIEQPPGLTVVAVSPTGTVLGTAKMGPNRPGPGAHVSTASFMVAATERGRGVGGALCRFALAWAKQQGYAAMQFNAVVESNTSAVELYQREGFQVIGTVPRSFTHPTHGRVGLHVMHQEFPTHP